MLFKKQNHNVVHCTQNEGNISSDLYSENIGDLRIPNGPFEGNSYMVSPDAAGIWIKEWLNPVSGTQ